MPARRGKVRGALVLTERRYMRLVTFRPDPLGDEVDGALRRDLVPALIADAGVLDAYVARRGTSDGDRVVATVHEGSEVDEVALLLARVPELARSSEPPHVEELVARVSERFERPIAPTILRIFRGEVRSGELDHYVEEAHAGMLADAAINPGLVAFHLGVSGPASFVTVSAWADWSAIERATGGNTRQPLATKNTARLVDFRIGHFEVLPDSLARRA